MSSPDHKQELADVLAEAGLPVADRPNTRPAVYVVWGGQDQRDESLQRCGLTVECFVSYRESIQLLAAQVVRAVNESPRFTYYNCGPEVHHANENKMLVATSCIVEVASTDTWWEDENGQA